MMWDTLYLQSRSLMIYKVMNELNVAGLSILRLQTINNTSLYNTWRDLINYILLSS